MSDGAPPPLDAAGIARRQFATARRGFDPAEVRRFLDELSAQVAELQRHESAQRARADDAEGRATSVEDLDEHRLVELLGTETARVLESAREAATDIRTKSEESAARLITQANDEAHRLRAEAEAVVARQRLEMLAEVEGLRTDAADELDKRRAEGDQLAAELRRAAERECEALRAEAEEDARQLVEEAQIVRDRMLRDLARRRRAAREQVERLNAARERLLAAHEVVRRTVDEATNELTVALPEAKLAGEAAMRRVHDEPEPTVEEMDEMVAMARIAGLVDVSTPTAVKPDVLVTGTAAVEAPPADDDEVVVEADEDQPETPEAEIVDAEPDVDDDEWADDEPEVPEDADEVELYDAEDVPEPDVVEAEAEDEWADEDVEAEVQPEEDEWAADEPTTDDADEVVTAEDDDWSDEPDAEEDEWAADDEDEWADDEMEEPVAVPAAASSSVDRLFARLKAETSDPVVPGDPLDLEREAYGAAAIYQRDQVVAVLDDEPPPDPDPDADAGDPSSADAADQPELDDDADPDAIHHVDQAPGAGEMLAHRDKILASVESDVARRLKMVLADEQNEVLDALRRGQVPESIDDLLPAPGTHAARYTEAAREDLAMVAELGAEAVGGEPDGTGEALAAELAQTVVDPLRERVVRCIDQAEDDIGDLTSRLRALFREWKTQRIAEAVRHFTAAAYAHGAYAAAPAGTALCWLVDRSGAPCADAEDNALAGAVRKGEPFPTGDHCPPAHAGCRCLAVPEALVETRVNEPTPHQ